MHIIVGIDEVGRGCWAGPVVAGAVALQAQIVGLRDSKVLSKSRREQLGAQIINEALACGLGWVEAADVDRIGLTAAVRLAMQRALAEITIAYDEVIIDGSYNFLPEIVCAHTLVKADALVPAVSAASIIAKVARDNYMIEMAAHYPGYGFEKHVGYGTTQHLKALQDLGVTDIHRRTYKPLMKILNKT